MKRYTFKISSGGALLVTNGVVILVLIGAGRVIRWIVNGIAHALVVRGGWAAADAAKAAPVSIKARTVSHIKIFFMLSSLPIHGIRAIL